MILNETRAILNIEKLPVMEHFYTIQGEGFHAGNAAYFVRLGGCDVGCTWCDVKESWNASAHPPKSVADITKDILNSGAIAAVITGGEPCMYNLEELTKQLKENGIFTWLETSGAYPITGTWDWICLSPKLRMEPVESNFQLANELKTVIWREQDLRHAERWANQVADDCLLYLQPEWDNKEKMAELLVNYVKQHPKWKLSIQTHKYIHIP